MSYILEALRKADAERERGSVPDLQSQLLPGSPAEDEPVRRRRTHWLWPGLAAGIVALGATLFWLFGGGSEPAGGATAAGSSPAASLPAASVAATPGVAPAASLPASAPPSAPAVASPPEKVEAPRQRRPPAAAAKAPVKPPAKAAAPKDRKPAKPAAAAAPASPPSAPAALVLRLNELPEDLRRQVPTLVVGGSVYSPQADKRMVIFNGQVFGEGTMLTPELKLEQIRPKSAVLSIRGQRFELPL